MITQLKDFFKNVDKKILKIMKNGIYGSLLIFMVSAIFLLVYQIFYSSPLLFYIGLSIFQFGTIFIISFIICGFAMDIIKKQLT